MRYALLKGEKQKFLLLIFTLFILYIGTGQSTFASDIAHDGQVTDIILSADKESMQLIMGFEGPDFGGSAGDIELTDLNGTTIDGEPFISNISAVGEDGRLIMTVESPGVISGILDHSIAFHEIRFAANSLQESQGGKNNSEIVVRFVTPPVTESFNVDDYTPGSLEVHTQVTTSAGTQFFAFFNKADYHQTYGNGHSYPELSGREIHNSQLAFTGPTFPSRVYDYPTSTTSMQKNIPSLELDKPYTVLTFTMTESGASGSHDMGARLYAGKWDDGMYHQTATNRPKLSDPRNVMTVHLPEADPNGYDGYIIMEFDQEILCNIKDYNDSNALPYGVKMSISGVQDNMVHLENTTYGFDAEIIGKFLVVKMRESVLPSSYPQLSLTIPAGTLKNSSGVANLEVMAIMYANFPEPKLVHHQIKPGTIQQTVGDTSNEVTLYLNDAGRSYNAFYQASDMTTDVLIEILTGLASDGSEDIDHTIDTPGVFEYTTLPNSTTEMRTTLADLMPQTEYLWLTMASLANFEPNYDMREIQVHEFETMTSTSAGTVLEYVDYFTGPTSSVSDDYILVGFSSDMMNLGASTDYAVRVDSNKDGVMDDTLSPSLYTVTDTTNPNEAKISFTGSVDQWLDNKSGVIIEVEVLNPSALEPSLTTGPTKNIVDTPDRSAELKFVELMLDMDTYIPVFNLNSTSETLYKVPLLPSDYSKLQGSEVLKLKAESSEATINQTKLSTGKYNVDVTAEEGSIQKTYTFDFIEDKYVLKTIKANGTDIHSFFPNLFDYATVLPAGSSKPSMTYELDTPSPQGVEVTVETTGDFSPNGKTEFTVKDIETNEVIHIYTVNFEVESGGTPVGFSLATYNSGSTPAVTDDSVTLTFDSPLLSIGNVNDYKLSLDTDKNGSGDIDFLRTHYSMSQPAPNQVRFIFNETADQLLDDVYNAQLIVELLEPAHLTPNVSGSLLRITSLPGRNAKVKTFNFSYGGYTVPLHEINHEAGMVSIPIMLKDINTALSNGILSGQTVDPNASMSIPSILANETPVVVTAEEGRYKKTYMVHLYGDGSLLESIHSNGTLLGDFSPYKKSYNVVLPAGTSALPSVEAKVPTSTYHEPDVQVTATGSLAGAYIVTINVVDTHIGESHISEPLQTYTVTYTVEESSSQDSGGSSGGGSSSGSSNEKSTDDGVIDKITSGSNEPLLKTPTTGGSEDLNTADDVENVTSVVSQVQTASGAKVVLEALPETVEALSQQQESVANISNEEDTAGDDLDNSVVDLVEETERIVVLVDQADEGQNLVEKLIEPIGKYYNQMDEGSLASKKLMNATIELSNSVIQKAGIVQTNWKTIEVSEGRVALKPTASDILKAVQNAAQAEKQMEKLLSEKIEEGVESAVVSTVTLKIPEDLENAAKTTASLDQQTLQVLEDNSIEQVNLELGPVSFGLNNKFIDAHQSVGFTFNVDRKPELSTTEKEALPTGVSSVGAPVLDLSAEQNNQANDAFNHPVELSLHLDYFDFKPKDGDTLFVARKNEETGVWEPAGGFYDPATNTMRVNRLHLSKYTVLKSEKNYSNIEDSWAKNEIASLKGKGIIAEDALFEADGNITREEFAGWISKAYGLDAETSAEDLKDLDPESPYYNAIATAYEQGIISGKQAGEFDPKGEVTKEELAVMIASAMEKYDYTADTSTFELAQYEEDLPTWAVNSVETVVENGIVDDSFFGSAEAVTREQAAAALYEVYR